MHYSSPRIRRTAQVAAACLLLTQLLPVAAAQTTHYSDVPSGSYYEGAASALLEIGALDRSEARLRPSELATRAEFAKLLVNLHSEALIYPSPSNFNDVPRTAWYFPYIEASAAAGWFHGDSNCYQNFRPCNVRPGAPINRAEAATLLVRAFALERTDTAPEFVDVDFNAWYAGAIQTAADHCVLQGDMGTSRVRPAANMNRAEMVVMFHRAHSNMQYGTNCGTPTVRNEISSVVAISPSRLRVTFSTAVNENRAEDESRYFVTRISGGARIDAQSAILVSSQIVEVELESALSSEVDYSLTAQNLLASAGGTFSDTMRFTFAGQEGDITNATAVSSTRVRLTFNTDMARSYAEDESRYTVTRVGGGTLGIQAATLLDSRTVELLLSTDLSGTVSYRINTNNLQTSAGVSFSDSFTFTYPSATTGHIISVKALSSTRVQIVFDVDMDIPRAEQSGRYLISDGSNTLSLRSANLLDDRRTVELSLADTLSNQRSYTVYAQEVQTSQGVFFTDSEILNYDAGVGLNFSVMLTGIQEIPPRITAATGSGTFTLTSNGLQYDITVRNMSGSITGAHFHEGASGISGPVVMPITFVGQRATGTWTGITNEQRNALLDRRIYVNIHTAANPEGEIRGQLIPQ